MKKRFRGKGRISDQARRDHGYQNWRAAAEAQVKRDKRRDDFFRAQWQQLYDQCSDPGSRIRLVGLREQYERQQLGVSEPAQVEAEVAMLMRHAGFTVAFLEESETRTADLECYWGENRMFVEVTAILGNNVRNEGWISMVNCSDPSLIEDVIHQKCIHSASHGQDDPKNQNN